MPVIAALVVAVAAAPSIVINTSGRLLDPTDKPVATQVALTFNIVDAVAAGNVAWTDTFTVTPVDGVYSIALGDTTVPGHADKAIPASAVSGDRWLEFAIGGELLSPRLRIGAAPYAVYAASAGSAATAESAATATTAGSITAGGATVTLGSSGKWPASSLEIPANLATLDTNGHVTTAELPATVATLDGAGHLTAAQLPASVALVDSNGKFNAANLTGVVPSASLPTLPVATATTPGVASAGAHLAVDGNGVLSVKSDFLPLAGGTLTGPLNLGGNQLVAPRIENASSAPATCGVGQLYYDVPRKSLWVCDGTTWTALTPKPPPAPDGSSGNAAVSCKAIHSAYPTAPDGTYWITANGAVSAFQAYCDMTADGGGWTLVRIDDATDKSAIKSAAGVGTLPGTKTCVGANVKLPDSVIRSMWTDHLRFTNNADTNGDMTYISDTNVSQITSWSDQCGANNRIEWYFRRAPGVRTHMGNITTHSEYCGWSWGPCDNVPAGGQLCWFGPHQGYKMHLNASFSHLPNLISAPGSDAGCGFGWVR